MTEQAAAPGFPLLGRRAEPLLAALRSRVVLADGAMGTMIYAKGVYINQCFDALNTARPHVVKTIHLDYLRAGAELLGTNTFGAHRRKLARHGLADKVHDLNLSGARLAREAAGGDAWVAGTMGPPGADAEGTLGRGEVAALYREQVEALLEGGVDALIFESFSHAPTLAWAVEEGRRLAPELPIIAMAHLGADARTSFGDGAAELAAAFDAMPADVVGFNDGPGVQVLARAIEELRPRTAKLLALCPGTGMPVRHEDMTMPLATPEYFMELLRQAIHKGARLVGGSCGSTPEHIKAIRSSIKMLQPAGATVSANAPAQATRPAPAETDSRFAAKMRAGKFVVSIEVDPPIGTDAESALRACEQCAAAGIDAINIADGPRASARMGPIDMATLLRARAPGIEPIVHFCCRDRNILGMQADLIGANALGIQNVLMITGDPPKLGDYPFATAVYDVDAIGALRIGSNLNRGLDLAGNPLKGAATRLFLGCGANPGAIDLDNEIARLERKIAAGAEYILTQPVYESALFERFHRRTEAFRVPVLIGILPLASYRNAEFLTKEVPGMQVPEPILERMRRCEDKDAAREEGIAIAREALADAAYMVAGTYIMPPFNRIDSALAVLEAVAGRR
ncbi:MAG: bifunctional homocysteine S-methyltransferase/methylenetetrahydrofolate reductase [Candidatus Sumerlaeia bacterium]|nr:bifunctional homocysteine S-methyltransferase/methylenetetrahydrofolate reductase [Candidatus Sumerlaeia bacterium]